MTCEIAGTIEINLIYSGLIRSSVGRSQETMRIPAGKTVIDILTLLQERYGDSFSHHLLTSERTQAANALIFLDGADIRSQQGLATPINDPGSIHILVLMHAMAGG